MEDDQYKIVSSHNLPSLENIVNQFMRQGWQPLGAPFPNPVTRNHESKYCQAMIRSDS